MSYRFITRDEWGSSQFAEDFIRNRYSATPEEKVSIQVHHTAAIDDDDTTPNRWDVSEAYAYMRRLQWSRPDLGPLPYSDNVFVTEHLQAYVLEGRGVLKVGAHTGGHNRSGYGLGVFGNFDFRDHYAAAALILAMEERVRDVREEYGLVNLGSSKNPRGWNAWGHRDTSSKSCPGNTLYPFLAGFKLLEGGEEEMVTKEEMVASLTPARITALVDANVILGGSRQQRIDHWVMMLQYPNDPSWDNVYREVRVMTFLNGALGR